MAAVEVKINNGPWVKAILEDAQSKFAWQSWHADWLPAPGEHTVTSRAIDVEGNVQPAMDEPLIATKKTYWEPVLVAVRPEHIATTGQRECPNRFLARVISSVYLGSISRHRLLIGSDEIIMQDHSAATELVANGSSVQIAIDPTRARVLPER